MIENSDLTTERRSKPWLCPSCSEQIGSVVFGQLYLEGAVTANTDGANLIIKCPKCRARKIWYASDRLNVLINEIAEQVARKINYSKS